MLALEISDEVDPATVVTFVLAVVAIVGLYLTGRSLRQTQQQIEQGARSRWPPASPASSRTCADARASLHTGISSSAHPDTGSLTPCERPCAMWRAYGRLAALCSVYRLICGRHFQSPRLLSSQPLPNASIRRRTERAHRYQHPGPRRDDPTLHDRHPQALTATSLPAPYTHAQGGSDPLLAIPGRAVRSSQNGRLMRLLYMTEPSRRDFLWR